MTSSDLELYSLEEHRLIAEWLGVPPLASEAKDLTVAAALEHLGFKEVYEYSGAAAVVAFICLNAIEDELPQWAVGYRDVDGDTQVGYSRQIRALRKRKLHLLPRFLFSINWATGGPGMTWPAAYYATWLPLYDRWAVTESTDDDTRYGYCDIAVGHFGRQASDEEFKRQAARVVEKDWLYQVELGRCYPWEYWIGGEWLDESTVTAIAERVWDDA